MEVSKKNLGNKNFLSAMASLLFNFSIVSIEKKLEKEDFIKSFAQVLEIRMGMDDTPDNRSLMLYAAANAVSKHR